MLANVLDRFRALALSLLLIAAFASPALAGPFEDAVGKFANDEFSDTDEAIGAVATSGNPLAFAIISALQDGRLMADPDSKKVYVTQPDGKIIDAATGAAVDKLPDGAAAVRLNNRLRRTVEAALGGLTLLSPDPAKRIQAAQSVFKTHDEAMLPLVDEALKNETVKAARLAFTEARAAILLFKPDATDAEKLEAIATIKARGDQEAMALLTGLTGDQPAAIVERRGERDGGHSAQPRAVVDGAERLVRAVAGLGAAARGHRSRHHLRGDGRHQHGPWRDGHDRRLCHLRGAGNHPHQLSRICSTTRC